MNIKDEVIGEIYKAFETLGAGSHLLSIIGSIGDTQSDDDVIELLQDFNNDKTLDVLVESDDNILFDAEQASKRNRK